MTGQTSRSAALSRTLETSSHTVYIVRAEDDEIVYVGRTVDLKRRMREHAKNADWHSLAIRVETEEYDDYDQAHCREYALIASYRPRGNRWGNPDYQGNCVTVAVDRDPRRELKRASLHALREARAS